MTSVIKVDQIQTAAGSIPTAGDLGLNITGSVLQTVHASTTTGTSNTTANTIVATSLSASITPKYSDSKILVMVSVDHQINGGNDCHLYLGRDNGSGTFVNALTDSAFVSGVNTKAAIWNYRYVGGVSNAVINQSPFGLFDAGQTTSITFKLYIGNVGGSTSSQVGAHDTQRMILQEIAG